MRIQNSITESFQPGFGKRWNTIQTGGGHLVRHEHGLRLLTIGASSHRYADAQIDDYARLPRRDFPWRPPLRLMVQARASGPLLGTAGFGLWNNPFSPFGGVPRLPAALWFFFASAPSNMPLATGVPGAGWKCATIDATTPQALRWAPFTPLVLLLNRRPRLARRIWPLVQRDLRIAEHALAPLGTTWREYMIEWRQQHAIFYVNQECVFEMPYAPNGPLGFIAWIDNQYAIATPQGQFGWGLLDAPTAQSLDLHQLVIERL